MTTFTASTIFSGLGGGALGLQRAGFKLVGAIDHDPAAAEDYVYLTGHMCTVADLQTMTVQEFQAAHSARPDFLLTSPPCKAFSGCLPIQMSRTAKYEEMKSLAQRGIMLALEAFSADPIPLIALENVPRIQSRGREWLDQIVGMLHAYGYAVRETSHDCGELGGLAQRRRRFLLMARHMARCPEFLYVPPVCRVRGVGEVLASLPVPAPGSDSGGPMHARPKTSAMNALRLAAIPAGGDWRDLPVGIALRPRASRQNGGHGVNAWEAPAHAIVGEGTVRNTWASVQDPRLTCAPRGGVYGVQSVEEPAGAVVGAARMDNGRFSLADPRVTCARREGSLGVKGEDEPSAPVIGAAQITTSRATLADPRPLEPTHALDLVDGQLTLVGPFVDTDDETPIHLVIRALDGTNHRPMTTLELAVLQGLPEWHNGDWLRLSGRSHKAWRQRIGNAIPPPAAEAIGRSALATLAAAREGSFLLCGEPVWVSPEERRAEP